MPRIGVEDRDDFGLGLPICNIANNKPHVKQRGCKVSFERERGDVEDGLDLCQLHRDIYVNCSFWFEHFETPLLTPTLLKMIGISSSTTYFVGRAAAFASEDVQPSPKLNSGIHKPGKHRRGNQELTPFGVVGRCRFRSDCIGQDFPCFLSVATLPRMATNMSRNSTSPALSPIGPCPGMTIVLSVTMLRFRSAARIAPSMLPPVE